MSRCPGLDRLIATGAPLPPFDAHVPLASLPGLLGTTLETVPAAVPYLTADPALSQRWREELYLDVPQEWDDPYRFFRW